MIKLSFEKPSFVCITDTDEPVTIALLKCKIINTTLNGIPFEGKVVSKFEVKGKTVCHKGDKYDEKYGKILALNIAKRIAYKKAMQKYSFAGTSNYFNMLAREIDRREFYLKMQRLRKSEEKDFDYLVKLGKVPNRKKTV